MFGFASFFAIVDIKHLSVLFFSICGVEDDVAAGVANCQDVALVVILLIEDDSLVLVGVVKKGFDARWFFVHLLLLLQISITHNHQLPSSSLPRRHTDASNSSS
jgi:hypothetical protein